MGIFFSIDDDLVDFEDPTVMVRDEHNRLFAKKALAPYILSELCALDMVYAVMAANDGYYKDRLSLKGGLSVRSLVPLESHRFSYDADFDPNTQGGFSYRDVGRLKSDLEDFGRQRGCRTPVRIIPNNKRLHFIEVRYRKSLGAGHRILESPKIEICKTCKVLRSPQKSTISTFIDLEMIGLEPLEVTHLSPEEQFADKLYVIRSSGRQRNHFDAYDAFSIFNNVWLDMKEARTIFNERCWRHKSDPRDYIGECRRQLDTMLRNDRKRASLTETMFSGDRFSFETMIDKTKSFYDFRAGASGGQPAKPTPPQDLL